mmetsp:Transcript_59648/g.164972  ORF Transcript_59648/g.164972 Transcript_59648/m.164972 type:complete len:84 (-) Transcript_59648:409-660(-)
MNPPHRYRLPFPRPFCFSFDRDYGSSRDSLIDDGFHVFLSHCVLLDFGEAILPAGDSMTPASSSFRSFSVDRSSSCFSSSWWW